MLEVICILIVLVFAFGQGHVAFINGFMWWLDECDGVEAKWNFDTFLQTMLMPIGLILASVELYCLFSLR